jgi:hypothetical protein
VKVIPKIRNRNSSAGPRTATKIRNSPEPERVYFRKKTMLKPGTTPERKILKHGTNFYGIDEILKPGTIPEPKILKNGTQTFNFFLTLNKII